MTRKRAYFCIGIVFAALVIGICVYRMQGNKETGYLGKEIVYFGDAVEEEKKPDLLEQKEETAEKTEETAEASGSPLPSETQEPAESTYPPITTKEKLQVYDSTGTVVVGDTGYELYNYVERSASQYAKAINKFTKTVDASVNVYELVVPTSVGITFPDNKVNHINSSSQKEALKNIQKKLSGREKFVPLYDIMMQHRTEYIYFRTDHHWTQLGAYYAYAAFCQAKGIEANPVTAYEKKVVKDFLGTIYVDSDQNKNLKKDDVELYYPVSKGLKMQYKNSENKIMNGSVIADSSNYGISGKYLAFINGDNPYSLITNKDKHDGSSCIVVKESFGNAFIPFLADHYEKIYVIDYRYWAGKLSEFVKQKRAKEVIIINNISMTRNSYLIGMLAKVL